MSVGAAAASRAGRRAERSRRTRRRKLAGRTGWNIVGIAVTVVLVFPVFWMISTAFKSDDEILSGSWLPLHPTLQHFRSAIAGTDHPYFWDSVLNSLFVVGVTVALSMVLAFFAAVALAKYRFTGLKFFIVVMIGIQMLSARIGWVTGEGLAANIARFCPRWTTIGLVGLLVVANSINIAADIGAMAEATRLLLGGKPIFFILGFGSLCVLGQVLFSYERSVRILKWLTLALFSYFAVLLVVNVPWQRAALESLQPWRFFPAGATAADYAGMVVAGAPGALASPLPAGAT